MDHVKISELDIRDFSNDGTTFEVLEPVLHPDFETDRRKEQEKYLESAKRFIRTDCYNYIDESLSIDPKKSFQILSNKMTNLISSGKIKKRIIREGYGDTPKNSTTVKIHYNAYTEHDCLPFDSTYTRNEPCLVTIGDGNVIRGLEIAVGSMQINEKSEFLIHPELAYKDSGLNRVKPNSVVLFEIEMFDIQSNAITTEEDNNDFESVYSLSNELRVQGNHYFKNQNYDSAVQKYKKAAEKLEDVVLRDLNDQDRCEQLLLKLYTNLLICYTKLKLPKKGCICANKIFYLVSGKDIPLSVKIFFNEARCLRMLGDYEKALSKLKTAQKKEPNSTQILNEIKAIEKEKNNSKKRDTTFGKALINSCN